jgi:hypothetical protein
MVLRNLGNSWECAVAFVCLMLVASNQMVTAQTVSGRLLDAQTGGPIPAATVALLDRHDQVIRTSETSPAGVFSLSADTEGRFRLRAEALGYLATRSTPIDLLADDVLEVELRLAIDAIPLDPLRVVGDRAALILDARLEHVGYYRRRSMRQHLGAYHLDAAEIRRRHHSSLIEVLRSLPGVYVRSGGGRIGPRGSHTVITDRGGLAMTVCLDGADLKAFAELDELVPQSLVLGVEVYASSAFREHVRCNIMIWTGIPSTDYR